MAKPWGFQKWGTSLFLIHVCAFKAGAILSPHSPSPPAAIKPSFVFNAIAVFFCFYGILSVARKLKGSFWRILCKQLSQP